MEPSKSDLSSCLYKNKCFFTEKSLHQLILNLSYFLLNPKNTLLFINENVHHNNSGTCMFDLMLNQSSIIESQTAWVILFHKGYLEVNLTRNNYNRLKILSAREEKKNIRNKFKKKHYLWFVTFRIIQQFFFSFYLRFSFSPLKSSNASMLITFQQHFFLFKHLQKYNLI